MFHPHLLLGSLRVIALLNGVISLLVGSFNRIQAVVEAGLVVPPTQQKKQPYERSNIGAFLQKVLWMLVSLQFEDFGYYGTHILNIGISKIGNEVEIGAYYTIP